MAQRQADPLDSPYLDVIGLVVESAAGIEQTFGRRLEREAGISLQWFDVLLRLARTPGQQLRMTDLAGQTTLSTSGLTRAVDRLVEARLVRREACPTDRRVAYATLTPAGRRCIDEAVALHVRHLDEVLRDAFAPDELDRLADGLRALRAAVNPTAAQASACPPGSEAALGR